MKKGFLRNASIVFGVNSICVIINVIVNFLIPILFGESTYAYYQLENLYCGYLWIASLGWHEGIYLYYGGKTEEEIDKSKISTQFWLFLAYMAIVSITISIAGIFFMSQKDKQIVLIFSVISILIEALRYVYYYYLICINNMEKYSFNLLLDRVVYIALLILLCITHNTDYRLMIGADILSKLIILLAIIIKNHNFFFRKLLPIKNEFVHTKELIFSGINITFSNFVNGMIKGTVRFAVESYWGILVFGKISLTLSVSNMFTQFIQSVSTVLFPVLRRFDDRDRENAYMYLSEALDVMMFLVFLFYLPAVIILNKILPQYSDGLRYMAVLLPISLYDARNIVLNNTYLKALRKERSILIANLITVGCSFLLTFLSVTIFHNLNMAVFSLVLLVAIRNLCAEYQLSNCMEIHMIKHCLEEWILTAIFIWGNWCIGGLYGTLIYLTILLLYLYRKRKNIKKLALYIINSTFHTK